MVFMPLITYLGLKFYYIYLDIFLIRSQLPKCHVSFASKRKRKKNKDLHTSYLQSNTTTSHTPYNATAPRRLLLRRYPLHHLPVGPGVAGAHEPLPLRQLQAVHRRQLRHHHQDPAVGVRARERCRQHPRARGRQRQRRDATPRVLRDLRGRFARVRGK